jgi:dTDP-glucose 4,6-dehydratase/UDP-glucuronate decarboxylase
LKAVVAGGAGMIGSSLCQTLVRKGQEVICIDNLSTGRIANIEPLSSHPRFHFIQHDVACKLPVLGRIDRVYHLASPASPVGYTRRPIETMLANSEGTRRLVGLALEHGARVLFCSTSEVYGDPLVHPQSESYRGNVSSIGPRAIYDESKRYGEAMTMAYVRSFSLEGRIVRIFNTYGPHADVQDGRVVVNFIGQALRGEPMTIYGDGMQTRSLCFVSDMVNGLIAVMESDRTRGEVLNLGNPDEHTVLEIAEIIRKLTKSSSPFIFTAPAVGDDPRVRRPNIDRARSLIGWEPRTPLEVGLRMMIRAMSGALNRKGKSYNGAVASVPQRGRARTPRGKREPERPPGKGLASTLVPGERTAGLTDSVRIAPPRTRRPT